MTVNISDRDIVVPGQLLGENIKCPVNCFREGDAVYSQVSGLVRVNHDNLKVIASQGSYTPKPEDVIIGVVEAVTNANFFLEIGPPFRSILPGEEVSKRPMDEDLTQHYQVGDLMSAKIRFVDEVLTSILSRPWKLVDGGVINVNPQRISRVIGKKKSMLEMLKQKTGCKIVVGQNGRVWVKGENAKIAMNAIKKIEAEAHTQGLTAKIGEILDKSR